MNLLIVSNSEQNTYTTICESILKMPKHVKWKILGNTDLHKELVALFGKDRFIHVPIPNLKLHVHEEGKPFDFLEQLSEKHIIIPTDFQSLKFLSQNRKSFNEHIVCALMDINMLLYLDDKHNISNIAQECGVRSPTEYSFSQAVELSPDHRLVVKPNFGDGSVGVFISQDKQHAIDYYEQLTPENKPKHIVQDYIDGDDFYYYAICNKGKILVSSIIIPGSFKQFGTHFLDNPSIDENAKKIIENFQFSGPISIDFRIDKKSKEVYLIEINPRNGNNSYLFTVAHTNWLFELANTLENPDQYTTTHKILTSKWTCYWRIPMVYLFHKWKLYSLWQKRFKLNRLKRAEYIISLNGFYSVIDFC